jgi:hypothetical protein
VGRVRSDLQKTQKVFAFKAATFVTTALQKKAGAIPVLMEPVFLSTKTESARLLLHSQTVAIQLMRRLIHKSVALAQSVTIVLALSTRRLTQRSVVLAVAVVAVEAAGVPLEALECLT